MTRPKYPSGFPELEDLGVRFAEFRSSHRLRERLPEALWTAAAEIAMRRGLNITALVLRLDVNNLKKRMGEQASPPKAKRGRRKKALPAAPAAFLELLAPVASAGSSCVVEVESVRGGKLRMELKGLGTGEIAQLLHVFAGH
jgi:hypothetical protein